MYQTTSIYLAAYLWLKGISLLRTDREGSRCIFTFGRGAAAVVAEFYQGESDIRAYVVAERSMRALARSTVEEAA